MLAALNLMKSPCRARERGAIPRGTPFPLTTAEALVATGEYPRETAGVSPKWENAGYGMEKQPRACLEGRAFAFVLSGEVTRWRVTRFLRLRPDCTSPARRSPRTACANWVRT